MKPFITLIMKFILLFIDRYTLDIYNDEVVRDIFYQKKGMKNASKKLHKLYCELSDKNQNLDKNPDYIQFIDIDESEATSLRILYSRLKTIGK